MTVRMPVQPHPPLPDTLRGVATLPGDAAYERRRHTYARAGSPAVVLSPRDVAGMQDAVAFAAARRAPLAVRSGGHGHSTNEGGIVLDLAHLRAVEVLDADAGLVRVEAGARWGEVAAALAPHGLAITSGDYGDVGVGGLATGGGIGLLARQQGLTIDRVVAAEVVLADGSLVRAGDDLLWALRGGGGAFGAVAAFELRAGRVGDVAWATIGYDTSDLPSLLVRWAEAIEAAPREVTSFLYTPPGPVAEATVVHAGGDTSAIAPFLDVAPVVEQRAATLPYASLVPSERAPQQAQADELRIRNGLVDRVTPPLAEALAGISRSGAGAMVQLRSLGGAVADVPAGATAFAHRDQAFSLVVATHLPRYTELNQAWAEGVAPHTRGAYLNFVIDHDADDLRAVFPDPVLERLHDVKRRYDPDGVFDANLPLPV